MAALGKARRVRPLLLILLWIWVLCMVVVLDLFLNVDELDGFRPRAKLYRGMRVAAHEMVGEPIEDAEFRTPGWRARRGTAPAGSIDVDARVRFCQRATHADWTALRSMALTDQDTEAACNAIGALGRVGEIASDPELVSLLHDRRIRVRQETIMALGRSGQDSGIASLEPLLADEDPTVRVLTIRAIGRIGGQRATELLQGVLDRPGQTQFERACARAALP